MKNIFKRHQILWLDKHFAYSSVIGLVLFFVSLYINNLASVYALRSASSSVNDIILDNIPIYNVNEVVTTGAFLIFIFALIAATIYPKKIPFLLKSAALFIVIRSVFITLTHLGPMPHSFIDDRDFFSSYNVGTDYFFSGHTGLPFLASLIFWDKVWLRYIFIFASLLLGASVLLGHLHYSIDVFAAFFITYTIYVIAQKFFPKDYNLSIK
jgi:membrane-associated phospholipid phosphatase